MSSFANNLRTLRKKHHYTQVNLANASKISLATLRRWESGETTPSLANINRLAEILHEDPESLVSSNCQISSRRNDSIIQFGQSTEKVIHYRDNYMDLTFPVTPEAWGVIDKLVEHNLLARKRGEDIQLSKDA